MSRSRFGTIIQIGDVLVSEDVVLEYFACDYEKCRGACCIAGDSGAPLKEEELEKIEREYPVFSALMLPEGLDAVSKKGFFDIDRDGDIVTPLIEGSEACAYAHFTPDGNCLCSMERCFFAGKCCFRKPESCWLYPIRVTSLGEGRVALNVHTWDICKDAREKGRREDIRVYQFLKEPLTEIFGEEFYSALSLAASKLIAAS